HDLPAFGGTTGVGLQFSLTGELIAWRENRIERLTPGRPDTRLDAVKLKGPAVALGLVPHERLLSVAESEEGPDERPTLRLRRINLRDGKMLKGDAVLLPGVGRTDAPRWVEFSADGRVFTLDARVGEDAQVWAVRPLHRLAPLPFRGAPALTPDGREAT